MTGDREAFRRLEDLFHRLAAAGPEDRERLLEQLRRSEPAVAAELVELLEADSGRGDGEVVRPEIRLGAAAGPGRRPEAAGFEVIGRIGEGGMGEVWEARQLEPVRRPVALKVVRWGLGSAEVLARFEAERQALAVMEHPGIARVFDAGATADGRPYFAMELVRGEPITAYCDRHRLTTDQRLELFAEVCEAVQHAHRKGILHRDLKPSNLLVSERDGRPVVKVIDFGIAKAIELEAFERQGFTLHGQLVGTPEYMSPEQAGETAGGVDTRSDVYSLGIVLHELLVGDVPLSNDALRAAGVAEMRRRIRERTSVRPSSRLEPVTAVVRSVAERRRTDPGSLRRRVRGDLDWIVLRAVAAEREARYGSASELAEDVRRHLRHEAVVAGPPTVRYRARKFVRRHRLGVAVAAALAAALVAGGSVAVWGLVQAREAQHRAELEAAAATWVSDFLVELFEVSDPRLGDGGDVTARELLDRGVERIDDPERPADPVLRSRLLAAMGRAYTGLGDARTASEVLGRSLHELRADPTAPPDRVAEGLRLAALAAGDDGRPEDAVELLGEAVGLLAAAGPRHALAASAARVTLAAHLVDLGRLDEATVLLDRAHAEHLRLAPDGREMSILLNNRCILEKERGDLERAAELCRESIALKERLDGGDSLAVAASLNNLAVIERLRGDPAAAAGLLERALEIRRRRLEPDHPTIAEVLNNLGGAAIQAGDLARARRMYEESLAIRERSLPPEHPKISQSYYNLACVANGLGDLEAVERFFVTAVDRGLAHPVVLRSSCLEAVRGDPEVERAVDTVRRRLEERQEGAQPPSGS